MEQIELLIYIVVMAAILFLVVKYWRIGRKN